MQDPSTSQAHAPGYPSGDVAADQAKADADLTTAVDEEAVAGAEADVAEATAGLQAAETQLAADAQGAGTADPNPAGTAVPSDGDTTGQQGAGQQDAGQAEGADATATTQPASAESGDVPGVGSQE